MEQENGKGGNQPQTNGGKDKPTKKKLDVRAPIEASSSPVTSGPQETQAKKKKERKPLVSPSSSFVDLAELKKEIYTPEDKVNNDYDPYSERKIKKPITDFETTVHLVKGCIGAGMLTMPRAFYYAGSGVGLIGTLLLGCLCAYGIHVMLRMKYLQCKWLRVPFLALPRALKVAFLNGPPPLPKLAFTGPFIADFFMVVYQIGLCSTYVTFLANSFKKIMEPNVFENVDIRIYMLILFFPILLVNSIRNLKNLSFVSLIGDMLIAAAVSLCFYYIFSLPNWAVQTPGQIRMAAPIETWPLFICITIFSFDAVGVMITLEHNMKNPAHFLGIRGLFPWSMVFIVILYSSVGLCTYLKYGKDIGETILSSLPPGEWLGICCQVMIVLAIVNTYPIQLYVGFEIIWGNYLKYLVTNRDIEYIVEYVIRTLVVLLTFVLAFSVPRIDLMVSLVGALCLSILSLIIPFFLELCTRYPNNYGRFKYILIKDLILIVIGLLILVIGTFFTMKAIIDYNRKN